MEMNITKILSLVLVKLKYIILVALIFALATFGYTELFATETYNSSAKFLVIMDEDNSKSTEANFVKEAIHSYLEIFNTTKFFNEVSDDFNSKEESRTYTAANLKAMTRVQSSTNEDAPSFTIVVTSSNPDICYELANTVAKHMIEKSLDYKMLNKIELIDDPIKPILPSSPNVTKNMVTGFFIGGILAAAFFVVKEMLDRKIKNLEDITSAYDIPILGVVPDASPEKAGKKLTDKED